MSIIIDDIWKSVPKNLLNYVDEVKSELKISNAEFFKRKGMGFKKIDVPQYFIEYQEDDTYLHVPRFFNLNNHVQRGVRTISQKYEWELIGAQHHIRLNPDQISAYQTLLEKNQIIQLGCGRGKTVLGINYICDRNYPALVILPTKVLLNQWKERISEFTNITNDEIGLVRGREVFDWKKKKVVLSTFQSMSLINYEKIYGAEYYKFIEHFGTIIFDEIHKMKAEQFRRVGSMFPGVRVGLSASARANNGMDRLYRLHVGDVVYTDVTQPLTPNIVFLNTPYYVDPGMFQKHWEKMPNISRMDTYISQDDDRTEMIFDFIYELVTTTDRHIMIMGNRKELLKYLYNTFVKIWEKNKEENIFGLVMGTPTSKKQHREREEALKQRVIFGIEKIVKLGLDISRMDTLVVINGTADKEFFQQSCGRICRNDEYKNDPVAYFFVDTRIEQYRNMFGKLRGYCRSFKYPFKVKDIGGE